MANKVNPFEVKIESTPAFDISLDMAKRSIWLLPLAFAIGGWWGIDGVWSAAYGALVIVVNFVLAAYMLSAAGRISVALMAGAALFGFFLRLGLMFAAVWLIRNASWVEFVPLGIMLIVTHLGLLLWELRYISGSMAFPGLKPKPVKPGSQESNAAKAA